MDCPICNEDGQCKATWFTHACKECGETHAYTIVLTHAGTGEKLMEVMEATEEEAASALNLCYEHKIELLDAIPEDDDPRARG